MIGTVAPRVEHLRQVLALRIALQQRIERNRGSRIVFGRLLGRLDLRTLELAKPQIKIGIFQMLEPGRSLDDRVEILLGRVE